MTRSSVVVAFTTIGSGAMCYGAFQLHPGAGWVMLGILFMLVAGGLQQIDEKEKAKAKVEAEIAELRASRERSQSAAQPIPTAPWERGS